MEVTALDYYRIDAPDLPDAKGQPEAPQALTLTHDGDTLEVPFGETIQASAHVGKPGSDSYTPPKVHVDILQELADLGQLTAVE